MRINYPGIGLLRVCLLTALFQSAPIIAGARVWTSSSGATVEAEFVKEEMDYVVLEREDGVRIKIESQYLSEKDRAYVTELMNDPAGERQMSASEIAALFGGQVEKSTPAGVQSGDAQSLEKDDQAKDEKPYIFDPNVFSEPVALKINDFDGLNLEYPDNASFVGVQYGPESNDVIFVAFDREDRNELPSVAFVHNVGAAGIGKKSYTVKSRRGREDYERKQYRVARFGGINTESSFGEHIVKAELQFYCGIIDPEQIYLLAEVEASEASRDRVQFFLWGALKSNHKGIAEVIGSEIMYGRPSMDFGAAYKKIYGVIRFGDFDFAPGKGVNEPMLITIKDAEGAEIEKGKADWDDDAFFENKFYGRNLWYTPSRMKKSGDYEIEASMDLGPILGTVEGVSEYTIK